MKTKIKNAIWLTILLAISFPIGFAFVMNYDRTTRCNERTEALFIGGLAMIIAIGGLSLIIRRILKRNTWNINSSISHVLKKKVTGSKLAIHYILKKIEAESPTTIALSFYTLFILIFFCISMWGFKQAMFDKCGFWL